MKTATWIPVFAALLVAAMSGTEASAGYAGAGSYKSCPTSACAPSGDYCAPTTCTMTCYKTVQEVVYDKQEVTCCKTVYDRVCEKCPITCYRNVYETHYRDECYTVCRPV